MVLVLSRSKRELGRCFLLVPHTICSPVLERDRLVEFPEAVLLPLQRSQHLLVAHLRENISPERQLRQNLKKDFKCSYHLVGAAIVGASHLNLKADICRKLP